MHHAYLSIGEPLKEDYSAGHTRNCKLFCGYTDFRTQNAFLAYGTWHIDHDDIRNILVYHDLHSNATSSYDAPHVGANFIFP